RCAPERHPDLSTVGVPGHDEVRPRRGERLQGPRIRSMSHAHPKTCLGVEARIVQTPLAGRAAAPPDVITVDMGVAEPAEVDAGALDPQARLGVVEEMPAPGGLPRLH